MKKTVIASLMIFILLGIFSSCNKDKTYAKRLSNERKIIDRFINENNINVLREYPKDSVFKENEFFFDTSSGIYYNVIDSGNGRRIKAGEECYIRFKDLVYPYNNDTTTYSNISNLQPEIFVYGNPATYPAVAWVAPLRNVGDRGKVKMIVPFNMGMSMDQQGYKTAYFGEVDYRFEQ